MEIKYKILLSEIVILIIGVLLTLNFKLFNGYMFLMMGSYVIIVMMFFGYSSFKEHELKNIDQDKTNKKESFPYTWAKANALIRELPGSEGLTWDEGIGVESSMKKLKNPEGGYEMFRSFLGYTYEIRKYILVIYNCNTENIVDYIPEPSSEEMQDPWVNFDPYEQRNNNQGFYPQNPYDRRYKHKRLPITNNDLDNDMDFSNSINRARDAL